MLFSKKYMRSLLLRVVTILILVASVSGAQPQVERTMAQSLFDRARALLEQKRYAEACPLFAESQRLEPAGGTLLNLALCHELEGKLATAHTEYNEALSQAIRDGRSDRKNLAEEKIAELAPRLSKLTLVVRARADVAGLVLSLDGTAVQRAVWGTPTVLDPGRHVVEARAPGRVPWSALIDITGERELRVLEVPELPLAPLAPETPLAPPTTPSQTSAVVSPPPPSAPSREITRLSTTSWAVGGTALAFLVAGGVSGVLALSTQASAENKADDAGCLPQRNYCRDAEAAREARDLHDRASTFGIVSTVAMGVGATGLVVALLLPRSKVPAVSASGHRDGVMFTLRVPQL